MFDEKKKDTIFLIQKEKKVPLNILDHLIFIVWRVHVDSSILSSPAILVPIIGSCHVSSIRLVCLVCVDC